MQPIPRQLAEHLRAPVAASRDEGRGLAPISRGAIPRSVTSLGNFWAIGGTECAPAPDSHRKNFPN